MSFSDGNFLVKALVDACTLGDLGKVEDLYRYSRVLHVTVHPRVRTIGSLYTGSGEPFSNLFMMTLLSIVLLRPWRVILCKLSQMTELQI